ncbi:MAG TPA: DUF447 family protein [Candidatus Korarchaeota archaeon]|nr:DUF447 family protein [Candidatus Korarchaeota archaeon]
MFELKIRDTSCLKNGGVIGIILLKYMRLLHVESMDLHDDQPRGDVTGLLDEFGFSEGLLVESIVTTLKQNKEPHFAPIGVKRVGDRLIIGKLFKNTDTYRNLCSSPQLVINLTDNVLLFYLALFDDVPPEKYTRGGPKTKIPYLREADAIIEADALKFGDRGDFVTVELEVLGILVMRGGPRFLSRCKHAVLESLVHFTRIPIYMREGREATELVELIRHYREFVERNCPEVPYKFIMRDLEGKLTRMRGC